MCIEITFRAFVWVFALMRYGLAFESIVMDR